MSALPFLLNLAKDMQGLGHWDEDHGFGLGILPRNVRHHHSHRTAACASIACPRTRGCPYAVSQKSNENISKTRHSTVGKDGFQVCINVQQFKPNELTVKTIHNTILVEGEHEEREDDHGIISRRFVRKYTLPKDYDPNDVVSTISSDGVLTVRAAPPKKNSETVERIVEIQHTGPAHLSVKENSEAETSAAGADATNEGIKNGEKSNEKMED